MSDQPTNKPTSRPRRHHLRTSLIALVATAVAAAVGAVATGALGGDGGSTANAAPSGPPSTAKVERTTLTSTETVNGTLGYGSTSTVQAPGGQPVQGSAPASGASTGIVTWLPAEGHTITRGKPVYSVNGQKVPLLYGSTPLYRALRTGTEGDDVKMLEKNLSALGYTGFTVDDEYTAGTAQAVREWQDDLGRRQTGTVQPGDAVVAGGARRVAEVSATLGATLNGSILTWTGTERTVHVDLAADSEDLVETGTKASVKLPDGTSVEAKVTDIGTAATAPPAQSQGGGDNSNSTSASDATLPVELAVADQKKLGRYQASPVDVTFQAETRKDVLAVPVNALVALAGGGYAVEAVTAGGTERRPVKLGMFASGMVEVSGAGVTAGLVVGVPK